MVILNISFAFILLRFDLHEGKTYKGNLQILSLKYFKRNGFCFVFSLLLFQLYVASGSGSLFLVVKVQEGSHSRVQDNKRVKWKLH